MITNPFKEMNKVEWVIWIVSLITIFLTNVLSGGFDLVTVIASCIGITGLLFVAKGNIWAVACTVTFSLMYGYISFNFRYWGEMITYLGMNLPIAIAVGITWLANPSKLHEGTVAIARLDEKAVKKMILSAIIVTFIFHLILRILDTPNVWVSTFSITTSFIGAYLTVKRSSYYAVSYAVNDVVLIVLWLLACRQNPGYITMVITFAIFFVNDLYGFLSWKKREYWEW